MKINKQYDYYAFDIVNLYLNLILEKVLNTITEFIASKFKSKSIKIEGFRELLRLVLYNNYFEFDKKFFLQIKGIAMGCKSAPAIANLYLSILEDKFLFIFNPFYYRRFIDDLLIMIIKGFPIGELFKYFENLTLTESGKNNTLNFLDVNIYLDYILNRVKVIQLTKSNRSI